MAPPPGKFNAAGRKRRRDPHNVDVKLVEIYEDLTNFDPEVRIKAALELVQRYTQDKNPSDEDIEKVLKRLFRGLCSGRKAARLGFATALTEILIQVFEREVPETSITVAKAIELWETQTTLVGDPAGQEEREYALGRIFGAEALVRSGICFNDAVPYKEWTRVLAIMMELIKKKPWMREEAGWILYGAVNNIAAKKHDAKYAQGIIDAICQNNMAKTPEGVVIWLLARDVLPGLTFPEKIWHHSNPLDRKERTTLAKVMKESSIKEEGAEGEQQENKVDTGFWNPKLHFAWDIIFARLYQQPPEKAEKAGKKESKKSKSGQLSFAEFWTEVVDEGLFAAASSDERKYWGFLAFMKVLCEGPTEYASMIFSKNLLRCMMNQLAVEDRYLHKMATKAAKTIQARVSKDPEFATPALSGLMGPNGAVNFDQITKTKTVEKIVSSAPTGSVKKTLHFFEKMIVNPGKEDEKSASSVRQGIAGLLMNIIKAQTVAAGNVWSEELQSLLENIVQILSRFGYFKGGKGEQPEPPIIPQTQEAFRNRVISCLNLIINGRQNPALVPFNVVKKIHDMHESGEWGEFVIDMDEKIRGSVDSAFKTLKRIAKKEEGADGKLASSIQALKLIYSMTLLQVYNGDPDAVSMLDDLKLCYERFLGKKAERGGDNDEASDAMVEILLSFASKGSQLFRKTSEQVFEAFADQVTATGLQSMIDILEAKDNLAGQQEMFENQEQGDEGDVDMMDVDMDSDDDDVEEISAEEGSSDEEDELKEGEGEEDEAELEAFDAKLAEALGVDQNKEEEGSDDEADMNDDDMEKIDDQIVKVFRARKESSSKKKDKKDAKENMLNFKNRVLDLLHIYVKKCHLNPIALDLLLPLLQLSRRSTVKQIGTRAGTVLRDYTKACKGSNVPMIEAESKDDVLALLKNVHQEATYSGPAAFSSACSQASLLLVKVLVAQDKETISDIVDIYGETRKQQLISKKCHVQPSFFSDWNNWCVTASKQFKS